MAESMVLAPGQAGGMPPATAPGPRATLPPAPVPGRDAAPKGESELQKIAADFESLFSQMMLSSMRKSIQKSPLFHGGRGEEIFQELLDTHYAQSISKRGGGLGLADMIVKKYTSQVRSMGAEKGRMLDVGRAPAGVPAAGGMNR